MEKVTLYPGLNVYTNASDDIDEILFLLLTNEFPWTEAKILESRLEEYAAGTEHKKVRDASAFSVSTEIEDSMPDHVKRLSELFNRVFDKCGFDFLEQNSIEFQRKEGAFGVIKYKEGQFILPHIDYAKEMPRKITMVYYPNDDYEGGELDLPNIGITLKPKGNTMVIFLAEPEDFRHASKKIISGTKYAVVSLWY